MQNQDNPIKTVHGTLIETKGVGVLIIGKSGAGKSDTALELITAGAKLISDDVVEIKMSKKGELYGEAPSKTKNLMEIRGLGIINIKDLFGIRHILEKKNIDIVIELTLWDSSVEYDRLGIEGNKYKILGVELPYILLPTTNTRHTATIIDLAVRNLIFQERDTDSSDDNLVIINSLASDK